MTCVITEPCIDGLNRSCVRECRWTASTKAANRCAGSSQIFCEDDVPNQSAAFTAHNTRFLTDPCPGATGPSHPRAARPGSAGSKRIPNR